jgi:hypothetical protein
MTAARSVSRRVRIALDRPRLWRLTAVLAALVLGAVLVGAAQGSMSVIDRRPSRPAGGGVSWERWCTRGDVRGDRRRLAFCARVSGIVLSSTRGPGAGEVHVAVVGGFHLTVVKLPEHSVAPSVGSRLTAVGPLLRARDGQREVQAFKVSS